MHYKKDSGFTLVEILLAIIAVAIVSFVGYYVYNQSSDTKAASSKSAATNEPDSRAEHANTKATASWKAYSSTTGNFSFRYPSGWVTHVCDDTAILLGPTNDSAGLCQSDGVGQVQVVSLDGDKRTDYKLDPASFPNVETGAVTVDGVNGIKESGTLQTSEEIFVGPQNGSKMVQYVFYTKGNTYLISYVQTPEFTDVLKDFELLVTETFKFSS